MGCGTAARWTCWSGWARASRDAILSGYAAALADLGAADPDDDLLAAAQRFLAWLSRTERRWLVVLDDLADPADLDGLWPFGTDGRVVVTARQENSLDGPNRRVVQVGSFTMREALAYLTARLSTDPGQRTEALDLATDLDRQPLALAHATAALICTGASCRDYRGWFHDRRRRLAPPAADTEPGPIDVTWSLAMDLADQIAPAGLARPMLALAALLDPAGIPGVVFTSQAACGYMTGHPAMPGDPAQAREAVHNLARAGLVTINPASTTRTVQVHPLIQALTRKVIPAAEFERAARSAADALQQAWPAADVPPRLAQALRDCTARLRDCTGDLLWTPEAHPVLLRAGESLSDGESAARPPPTGWPCWTPRPGCSARRMPRRCAAGTAWPARTRPRTGWTTPSACTSAPWPNAQRALGNDHPDTLASCAHLGRVYAAAGRHGEALPMYERVVADREWVLGARHPETLAARGDLAAAYLAAGRPGQALPVYEQTLADLDRALGPGAPGHAQRPGRPGPRVPDGGRAEAGRPGVRANPGRTGEGPGPGPPGHHQRPGRPGLRLPDRGPDEARHPAVRAGGRGPGAGAGQLPPGHAHRPGQPGQRLPGRTAAQGRAAGVRADAGRPGDGPGGR